MSRAELHFWVSQVTPFENSEPRHIEPYLLVPDAVLDYAKQLRLGWSR